MANKDLCVYPGGTIIPPDRDCTCESIYEAIGERIPYPEEEGENGQVLSVDEYGNPIWKSLQNTNILDNTLSVQGEAPDSKAVGDSLRSSVAPAYSDTATYSAGDFVLYQNTLYRANQDISAAESWDPSHWTQVTLGEEVTGIKEDLSELADAFEIELSLQPTATNNLFVDASNNNLSTSENFALLGPVPVKVGQKVVFNARGYSTVVGMICTCNADNTTRTTVVRSVDDTKREYTYDVLEDGYIVLSYVKSDGYELNLTIDYYRYLNVLSHLNPIFAGEKAINIIPLLNGFVDPTTNRFNTSNSFKTSDSITIYKGQTINLTATGYRTNVGMINIYDANADTYQSVSRSVDDTERLYTYTADEDCILRVCYLAGTTPSAAIVTSSDEFTRVANIETDISDLKNPIEYPQLFDNILCIGDSLTVGASGNGNEILTKNYPHFLHNLADAETTVMGHGGYSAKQVWDSYVSSASGLSNYDCAIIYLGTNGGLTDTVDEDCNADYTENADTNTGCYGKIIGKIKEDAPNCKIFCIAGANENIRRETTMNPAVRSLSDFYDVGLVDIEGSILSDDGSVGSQKRYIYRPVDAIHYNALGYLTLANLIYDGIHEYIGQNLIKFA